MCSTAAAAGSDFSVDRMVAGGMQCGFDSEFEIFNSGAEYNVSVCAYCAFQDIEELFLGLVIELVINYKRIFF